MSTCGIFSYNNVGAKNMSTLELQESLNQLRSLNSTVAQSLLDEEYSFEEICDLDKLVSKQIGEMNSLLDKIQLVKERKTPTVKAKDCKPELVSKMIVNWTENSGGETGDAFKKDFVRVFKNMMKSELSKVGAVDLTIDVNHYCLSGFFTIKSSGQVYYFSLSDVRYFHTPELLIRRAKDYKDFKGEQNHYIKIYTDMFVDFMKEEENY